MQSCQQWIKVSAPSYPVSIFNIIQYTGICRNLMLLMCIFIITVCVDSCFYTLMLAAYLFQVKLSVQIICPFLHGGFCILIAKFWESFSIFNVIHLSESWYVNISFLFCGFFSLPLTAEQISSILITVSLANHTLAVIAKKCLPDSRCISLPGLLQQRTTDRVAQITETYCLIVVETRGSSSKYLYLSGLSGLFSWTVFSLSAPMFFPCVYTFAVLH